MFITPETPFDQASRPTIVTFGHILAVIALLGAAATGAQESAYRDELRNTVEAVRYGEQPIIAGRERAAAAYVTAFYERRSFIPAWREEGRIAALLTAIRNASAHGLTPDDYHLAGIETIYEEEFARTEASAGRWAALELVLTDALMSLVHDLHYGKVDPQRHDPAWNLRGPGHSHQTLELAEGALAAPALDEFLEDRFRRNAYYRRLQSTLAEYRRIANEGGWPLLDAGPSIRLRSEDERLPVLAARLAITGDFADTGFHAEKFAMDEPLEGAVRRFQSRHGLDVDGVVGAATLRALNVSVEQRILQLRLALERVRWVIDGVTDSFVVVNIASFRAYLVSGGQIIWETRVVVGRDNRQTPSFRDELKYIVFNPTWTVPYSIATRELLPQIKADPDWFRSRNFEVRHVAGNRVDPATVDWQAVSARNFQYILVQRPGPNNALGQVKFMFPNEHAVYLHDTPARELFGASERAFSHGCIRVENPLNLAEVLLEPNSWDRQRIDAALATGKPTTVYLARPLPILLLYLTANVDPDGTVHFYRDIYRRDGRIAEALDGPRRIN